MFTEMNNPSNEQNKSGNQPAWQSPLINKRVVSVKGSCENTPFLFKDRLYRLENFKRGEDFPGEPLLSRFHEDGFRIRDEAEDRVVSVPLLNHYFGFPIVQEGRVYVFCGDSEFDRPCWHIRHMVMISSDDLITWTKPQIVLKSAPDENIYNIGIIHDGKHFVMLYETNDPRWPKFTFKFAESDDLVNWRKLDDVIFGAEKGIGGPAFYYLEPYYYVTYTNCDIIIHELPGATWDTRVSRSLDLRTWEDAPKDRPLVSPDPSHRTNPELFPNTFETNASDLELIELDGKVHAWWSGCDQKTCGDLKRAEFPGTLRELFALFYQK